MSLTLEQVMQRARKACDRLVDDTARAFETRAILTGADPDAIDAEVAAYRERLTQAIADGLSRVRSELVAWAAETPGGCRNVPTDEPPRTPRGAVAAPPLSNRAAEAWLSNGIQMAGVKGKSGGHRPGAGRPRRSDNGVLRRKARAVRKLPKAAAYADAWVLSSARVALELVIEITAAGQLAPDLATLFRRRAELALASLPGARPGGIRA